MEKQNGKPLRLKHTMLQLLFVVVGILPLLATLSYIVSPSFSAVFHWFGLMMPVFICLNIIILLISLCYRSFHFSIPLLSAIACIIYLPLVVQWNPFSQIEKPDIRLASYNVKSMKSTYGFSTLQPIAEFAKRNHLDVLFMQEVPSEYKEEDLLAAFAEMKEVAITKDKRGGDRLVILSKFPLTGTETLSFEERPQCVLLTTLNIQNQKVMLVNCHLQTTNWNQIDKDQFVHTSTLQRALGVVTGNFERRAHQALTVRARLDSSSLPLLVAGDFNAPPVSFSYHTIGSGLKDSFREAGNGYGYTYRYLNKLFRIDYIFFSGEKFRGYNYRTEDLDYSDHLPVLVDLEILNKENDTVIAE